MARAGLAIFGPVERKRGGERAPGGRVRKWRAASRGRWHFRMAMGTEESILLDREFCYRSLRARDARFDGRLFVAVRTTGIYCRPICPARTPKLENITFYASAAAAQEAGYRPCLWCRPASSPQPAPWRGTSNTGSRAMMLIAEGALDGDEADVEALAQRLGVGARQLRRGLPKTHRAAPT